MCDTHEGSSRTQWELQSCAGSHGETTTVCFCLLKMAWAAAWWRVQAVRVWLTVVKELLNFGSIGSTRFHPCWPKKEKKKPSCFSSAQRTIIGRLTGVESNRELVGAKGETNLIKEEEEPASRNNEKRTKKGQIERQRKRTAQEMISRRCENKTVEVWKVRKRTMLQEHSCVLLSRQESCYDK